MGNTLAALSKQAEKVYGTAADATQAELVDFYAYWNAKRGERHMPAREDIQPRDIARSLKRIHLYDVVDDGADFRIRVTGTAMFLGYYPDPTGRMVSDHPEPALRHAFRGVLNHVMQTRAPVYDHASPKTDRHLTKREAFSLWLPLGRDRIEHVIAQSLIVRLAF